MAYRNGHGTGAGSPRIEVLPPDELPHGVQAEQQGEARGERTTSGRWLPGASTAQRKGGSTKAKHIRLARRLGLAEVAQDAAFAPYQRAATEFRRAQCRELAHTVGGGVCGPGPSSIVASAALALAASRFLYDRAGEGGDPDLFVSASRLAESSRQHLLAAHELCAREAKARRDRAPLPELFDDVGPGEADDDGGDQ